MSDRESTSNRHAQPPKRLVEKEPLRFGIDIDGTISQAPRHFKRLIDALLGRGDKVYIITGRTEDKRQETQEFLDRLGVRYTELIMRPSDWPDAVADYKVNVVQDKGIHLMIDDNEQTCWAIEQRTRALAAHMLPIPEMLDAHEVKKQMEEKRRKKKECK